MEFILIAVALLCIGGVASLISCVPSGGQIGRLSLQFLKARKKEIMEIDCSVYVGTSLASGQDIAGSIYPGVIEFDDRIVEVRVNNTLVKTYEVNAK